jgi:hypothetical protein
VLFTSSDKLGVYTVVSNQSVLGSFAVNLFNATEGNIRPATTIKVGRADVAATPREEVGQLEIWPWLALAAFALLLLEWWIYHRGATLPAAPGVLGWFRRRKTTA